MLGKHTGNVLYKLYIYIWYIFGEVPVSFFVLFLTLYGEKPYILSNDNSKTENEVKALVAPPSSLLLVLILWFFISRWAIAAFLWMLERDQFRYCW